MANQYDPNQQQPNQSYPPLGQQQPQYQQPPPQQPGYQQPPYQQDQQPLYPAPNYPPPTSNSLLDQVKQVNVGIIAAGALFIMLCLVGACVIFLGLIRGNPVPPPSAATAPTATFSLPVGTAPIVVTPIPAVPTFDPNVVNTYINPYYNAQLTTMTQLFIDVMNPQTGQFERKAQLLGANLDPFAVAFNIAGPVSAPNANCPERVRLTAVRADNTQAVFGVCLNNAVILRSADVTDLNGGDLEMGPYFIDVLSPYLPAEYRQMLGIS